MTKRVPKETTDFVICDACVLINLAIIDAFKLLKQLQGYRFYVPQAVLDEVLRPAQKKVLKEAMAKGWLLLAEMNSDEEQAAARDHMVLFGLGESTCLALAQCRGWSMASDETALLAAEIAQRLGKERHLTTVDILLEALRQGRIDVKEADRMKAVLEGHRFKMNFASFSELV